MKVRRAGVLAGVLAAATVGVVTVANAQSDDGEDATPNADALNVFGDPCGELMADLKSGETFTAVAERYGLSSDVEVSEPTSPISPPLNCFGRAPASPDGEPGAVLGVMFVNEARSNAWLVLNEHVDHTGTDWTATLADYGFKSTSQEDYGFYGASAARGGEPTGARVNLWTALERSLNGDD